MDNLYKKIETELNTLSPDERREIMTKLRDEIDDIDQKLVHLLSRRTLHSVLIGRVKRSLNLPTYNPQREKQISERISSFVEEPLSKEALLRIYERIIDESRAIQRAELDHGNIFNTSRQKMKIGLSKLLSRKELTIVIGFFAVVLALLYFTFFTPNHYTAQAPVKLEVKIGEPFGVIVDDLYGKGIIPSKFNFRIAAFIYGAERKIRAARYYIPNDLSYLGLLDFLLHSNADLMKNVTVYPGSSVQWIAAKLYDDLYIDSASVADLCSDKDYLDSLGFKGSSLLGYLMPKRYELYERSSPREVISKMYDNFKDFFNDSLQQRAKKLGYTEKQIVTMASIVEGETKHKSEMPVIAGVYYNRLKKGMKLQADPTIEFIKKGKWGRVSFKDLSINSPYNTYKYTGLPPGPINNPGKNAIMAALYPEKTNYLYFVANGNGSHHFSSSYQEHIRNANKYRKWLDSLKK